MDHQELKCPECSEPCRQDSVDVGVGVIYGPWGCSNCGWSEDPQYDCSEGKLPTHPDYPGRYVDPFGSVHSVVRTMENTGNHMSVEAGVLVDLDCNPIYWHNPAGRTVGSLPDSRELWDVIWEHRERVLGFAHSHPGFGEPGPSYEDVTTFHAVEAALGKRLVWWITTADRFCELCWVGPGRLDYRKGPALYKPPWMEQLRRESGLPKIGSQGGIT